MSKSRQKERAEESRNAIVEAAFDLFSEKGYHATSIRDIAAVARVTEGLIYHYFESKADLLPAVFEKHMVIDPLLINPPRLQEGDGLREFLKQSFSAALNLFEHGEMTKVIRIVLSSITVLPREEQEKFLTAVNTHVWIKLADALRPLLPPRSAGGPDPYVFFRLVLGAFISYALFQEVMGGKTVIDFPFETYRDEVAEILAAGVKNRNTE